MNFKPVRTNELSEELLIGAIDIHVHPGPHLMTSPRRLDPIRVADSGQRCWDASPGLSGCI